MTKPTVGFAGMTHLGINSLAATAARGFQVLGFDPNPEKLTALSCGECPITEPDLPEYLLDHGEKISFSSSAADLGKCDVVYVAPDVPTDDEARSDLAPILEIISIVQNSMRDDAILVVLSQVPPGFIRTLTREKSTLYYQVETLIFGRAIERAMYPERIIVGCADPTQPLAPSYEEVLKAFECPVMPMRYESAELCKISINLFLVASVTTANTIAELCERIGADWNDIVPALRLDKRIGKHAYLLSGLGISGGNLERDLATFSQLSNAYGTENGIVRAAISNSRYQKNWVLRKLHEHLPGDINQPTIGVLGIAYKENTHSTKNSPALELLSGIPSYPVRAYDPVVIPDPAFHPNLTRCGSMEEACDGVDALVIMTPWDEFRDLPASTLVQRMRGKTVVDPYQMLNAAACSQAGLDYITLGKKKS